MMILIVTIRRIEMDRLKIKEEREKILVELKNNCNKIYINGNMKTRLEIVQKNGEGQFKLNTDQQEFSIAYKILSDEFKALGLDQIAAELSDKK